MLRGDQADPPGLDPIGSRVAENSDDGLLSRRQVLGGFAALGCRPFLAGCGGSGSKDRSTLVASAWPQANALFLNDPKWIGGDGAYSVDLGNGRVLWLFGDSFIANTAARLRSSAVMVHNSLAIQNGYDPTTATIKFYWNGSSPTPAGFFPAPSPTTWLWPYGGVMINGRLIIFLNENQATSGGLGFLGVGWTAVAVQNPSADPSEWKVTNLATKLEFGLDLGAATIVVDGFAYAFTNGLKTPGRTYVARWPVSVLGGNSLVGPQWYAGERGWVHGAQINGMPTDVANVQQSIFSINPSAKTAPYVVIQTSGFGGSTVAFQTATHLTGPYSGAQTFYNPPEASQRNVLIYGGLMHSEQTAPGYDVVATYNVNNTNFSTLVSTPSIYYPMFIRAKWKA